MSITITTEKIEQKCFKIFVSSIAANHSDFGGILPIFKQYSAIPIGMTVFRQNVKKYVTNITVKTTLKVARHFILLNMYGASVLLLFSVPSAC